VEVGETSEEAVRRELMEEMNVSIGSDTPKLFGIYGDPMRDARRHTTSIVYVVDIPEGVVPRAGDDAAEVVRVAFEDIERGDMEFFADHDVILSDYIRMVKMKRGAIASAGGSAETKAMRRDLCVSR